MRRKSGTFQEFKNFTLAVARGERRINPDEPRVWSERIEREKPGDQLGNLVPVGAEGPDYRHSMLRERIVEHIFVAEALRKLWSLGARDVEVLRSEFDAGGYDLVLSHRNIVRHIQFKSTAEGGKARNVSVNLKLMEKPSGCVIWIVVTPKELDVKTYRWLGGAPGQPLPADISEMKKAKFAKGNAEGIKLERPGHRIVPVSRFESLTEIDDVLARLFGPLP